MSAGAKTYYQKRAEIYGLELAPILGEENPRCILASGERPAALGQTIIDAIDQAVAPVEPFLKGGIAGVFDARDQHLGLLDWQRLQTLPRFPQVPTLKRHLGAVLIPKLAKDLSPSAGIYLEALSQEDIKRSIWPAWGRATIRVSDPPQPNEDAAQAYFLTRVVDESFGCTKAVFTLAWQAYFEGWHTIQGERKLSESLTARYSSVLLLANEVESLPPLQPLP